MIDLKKVPREPISGFEFIVGEMMSILRSGTKIGELKRAGHRTYRDLLIGSTAAKGAADRIVTKDLKDELNLIVRLDHGLSVSEYLDGLEQSLAVIYAFKFDEHFDDPESEKAFNRIELSDDEKERIRELMAEARQCVLRLDAIGQKRKQNINFWITKIENELSKDISLWQSFVAGSHEILGLVKDAGEAAQPIAEAIAETRTITHRNVDGYRQIEAEEKPKQIEDKSGS